MENNIDILRFKPLFRFGATIYSSGVLNEIKRYHPDAVIAIGIAKIFPVNVLIDKTKRNFLLLSFFGENSDYYAWNNNRLKIKNGLKYLTRLILKKPFYELAIKTSDKIFLYTPDTFDFLQRLISKSALKSLKEKFFNTSLGFDSSIFYFDIGERMLKRDELNVKANEFIFLTVTRYSKSKSLEFLVDKIIELKKIGYPVKYWIIGFIDQQSLDYFRQYINSKNAAQFISCFGFMPYDELRRFQAAADAGLWCQVSISIQQCMGSGLPVLLEQKKSVSHLLIDGENGLYFKRETVADTLVRGLTLFNPPSKPDYNNWRKSIEISNHSRFSYGILVKQIFSF